MVFSACFGVIGGLTAVFGLNIDCNSWLNFSSKKDYSVCMDVAKAVNDSHTKAQRHEEMTDRNP